MRNYFSPIYCMLMNGTYSWTVKRLFRQSFTKYTSVSLSSQIFDHTSREHSTSPFPFFLCKTKQVRTCSRDASDVSPNQVAWPTPNLPSTPPPPPEQEISRETALLSELTEVTGELLWREGVAQWGSFCFHSSVHGRSKGLRGLPESEQPNLENGGGKWRVRWQSYQKWNVAQGGRRP